MSKKIIFTEDDRIAIIAPHPDDECMYAAGVLLLASDRTDIFVLTDGSHGNKEHSIEEEAAIRKKQFDAEMAYIKPHAITWFGIEDTKLLENAGIIREIDFTPYTRIFLPWIESLHPDHRAAAATCINEIRNQGCHAECYSGEIFKPFPSPSHYIDITSLADEKRKLIRFHEDQAALENVVLSLNAFRAAQMMHMPECRYAECFDEVRIWENDNADHKS
jgi:LmbE family N-acetylglucosaminyl deacetylase